MTRLLKLCESTAGSLFDILDTTPLQLALRGLNCSQPDPSSRGCLG